jgi:hypothetical protein
VKKLSTLLTLVGTVFAARSALSRMRQARDDGDRLELLDAVLNSVVVVTGTLVVVRRLRRGEDEA